MDRKNILKHAGVFLMAVVMVLSTVIVTGDTRYDENNIGLDHDIVPTATPAAIQQAIDDGVTWLVAQQNTQGDPTTNRFYGSWGPGYEYWNVGVTGLVLIKLQDYAYEQGYDSPFNPSYKYSKNVIDGWTFLFKNNGINNGMYACTYHITPQYHTDRTIFDTIWVDDPDTNGNGHGIIFNCDRQTIYDTGICLAALVASGDPDHPNEGAIDYDNNGITDTFGEIAQEIVDGLAWAQCDDNNPDNPWSVGGQGGWYYFPLNNENSQAFNDYPDNSVSGYVCLGLAAAEATKTNTKAKAFGCTIPSWIKRELNVWINFVQNQPGLDDDTGHNMPFDPDGGSGYDAPNNFVNELKTGNLIFEMTFCGDSPTTTRFENALTFIERYWKVKDIGFGWGFDNSISEYQAMFCLMKGLEYSNIALIDTDGVGGRDDNWFNQQPTDTPSEDFASVLVDQQDINTPGYIGSWPNSLRDLTERILSTTWALLTLEKVVPLRKDPLLTKEGNPSVVYPGNTITYTIKYINSNLFTTLHNVIIVDYVDPQTVYYSNSATPDVNDYYQGPPETLTWNIGNLNPFDSGTITFSVTVINPINPFVDNVVYMYSDETFAMAREYTYINYGSPDNSPPEISFTGPTNGKSGVEYNYTISANDPETDHVFFYVDWGDNNHTEVGIGPYDSGEQIRINNAWSEQGTYVIRAKAKDQWGYSSDWVNLSVIIPCSYNKLIPQIFEWLFQRSPHAFPLLRQLMNY